MENFRYFLDRMIDEKEETIRALEMKHRRQSSQHDLGEDQCIALAHPVIHLPKSHTKQLFHTAFTYDANRKRSVSDHLAFEHDANDATPMVSMDAVADRS
eukprot:252801_1